jgi:large conductance mechanosensitive channel
MLKGFKDFLLRGNVIDLAVAVVIGAAFGAVVTSVTDKILKPLINAITPPTSPGFGIQLVSGKPSTFVDFAALITAAINFLIVAAVIYFAVVVPVRMIQDRRKRGEEPGPAEPTDVELLKEIRDLLRTQAMTSGSDHARTGSSDGASPPTEASAR